MVDGTACCVAYRWANLGKVFQMETCECCNPRRQQAENVDPDDCGWAFALAHRRGHCSNQKEETEMSQAKDNLRAAVDKGIARKMQEKITPTERAYTIKEMVAVFYSQWVAPQEVDKNEKRMMTDLVEALEDPNRCQCIGDDMRLLNDCENCPR